MSRGLADTSVFIARESGRAIDEAVVPEELAISVITLAELEAGVLAATDVNNRARRLATLALAMSLDPIPIDEAVARQWARLRVVLRDYGQRLAVNDSSWIAATAMAIGVPVVTQDADFPDIEGLDVIRV